MPTKVPGLIQRLFLAAVNLWESPGGAMLVAGLIYCMVPIVKVWGMTGATAFAYYNYLADAFLHGSFSLRLIPPSVHDLVFFDGKYFLYWPPFPAMVLMPFIALFGVQFNDVMYTVVIGVLNVGLIALLIRAACQREFLHLSKTQRCILVLFFALGTAHVVVAQKGTVWHTGQLIGFTCTILAYLAAFSLKGGKAWFLTGLALSAAMLSRSTLVFTGIFPVVYLLLQEKPWNWRRVASRAALAALPVIVGLIFYLYYNQARFGNPFDTGIAYHNMDEFFRADYERYGAFNLHYVPINLYYQFIFYPFPLREETFMGGSLFLLSPLFFAAVAAFWKPRLPWANWALLFSILITYIPIVLLMGTGWIQFGPRYTLDFTVPLLLLTALGMERWKTWLSFALTLAAIIQYFCGFPIW